MERIGLWKRLYDPYGPYDVLVDNKRKQDNGLYPLQESFLRGVMLDELQLAYYDVSDNEREQYCASFPPSQESLTFNIDPNELPLAYHSMRILSELINGKPGNCVFIPPLREDDGISHYTMRELIRGEPSLHYYRGYLYADLNESGQNRQIVYPDRIVSQGRIECTSIPLPVLLTDQDASIIDFLTRMNRVIPQLRIVPQLFVKSYLLGRLDEYDKFMYERGERRLHEIYPGLIREAIDKPWCWSVHDFFTQLEENPPPPDLRGGYEGYWRYLKNLQKSTI